MATTTKTWAWATTLESWAFTQDASAYWTGVLDTAIGNPADSLKANVSTSDNSKTAVGYWSISGTWAAIFSLASGDKVTQVRLYGIDTRNGVRTNVTSNAFGDSQTPTNGLYCDALTTGTEVWAGRVPTGVEGTWTSTGAGSNVAIATAKQASSTTVVFRLYVRGQWGTANPVIQMNWDNLVIEITYSPQQALAGTSAASGSGSAAGTNVNPLAGTSSAAGSGSAAGTNVSPLAGTSSAAGGTSAAGTNVNPLAGTSAAAGSGSAAGDLSAAPQDLAGSSSAAGSGSAAGINVNPLAGTSAAAGSGSAAGTVWSPLEGTSSAAGSGSGAGTIYGSLEGTSAAAGSGSGAGTNVSPLAGSSSAAGNGSAAGTSWSSLGGESSAAGNGSAAGSVIEPSGMQELSGTSSATGSGSAAGFCWTSLSGSSSAAGSGSAAGTCWTSLDGASAAAGSGSGAGTSVSVLGGTSSAAGAGSAAGTSVNPLAGTSAAAGSGSAAGAAVSPLEGTSSAVGNGSAAGSLVDSGLVARLTFPSADIGEVLLYVRAVAADGCEERNANLIRVSCLADATSETLESPIMVAVNAKAGGTLEAVWMFDRRGGDPEHFEVYSSPDGTWASAVLEEEIDFEGTGEAVGEYSWISGVKVAPTWFGVRAVDGDGARTPEGEMMMGTPDADAPAKTEEELAWPT